MSLLSIQRPMARAVMKPLTPAERMRPTAPDGRSLRKVASDFIKPNDRLTSFERLEIYNRQYWFRVLSAFAEDFPGLRAVLGERKFDAAPRRTSTIVLRHPSRCEISGQNWKRGCARIRNGLARGRSWRSIWFGWSGPILKRSTEKRNPL